MSKPEGIRPHKYVVRPFKQLLRNLLPPHFGKQIEETEFSLAVYL